MSLFTVECSQPEPDLLISFLYLLLANNAVCGVVGLGYLNKTTIREAYELATCLIQPSLVESGTLPLFEAMLMNTPVLVADRPYAHDQCGAAAIFFDPLNSEDFARKTIDLLQNEEQRNKLVCKGTHLANSIQAANPYSQLLDVIVETAWTSKGLHN